MQRIPCYCNACHEQLNLAWDDNIADDQWSTQKRFEKPVNCSLEPILSEQNNWRFVRIVPTKKSTEEEQEEELNGIYAEVLHQYEANAIDGIIHGGYGAMDSQARDAKDGYYLIRWTGTPYLLTAPNANVQGCNSVMPAGTFVCKGRYLTRLNRAPHWYYYDSRSPPCIFCLQFIVAPNIEMIKYHAQTHRTLKLNGLYEAAKRSATKTIQKVPQAMQDLIAQEKILRDKLDYADYQMNDVPLAAGEKQEDDDDEDDDLDCMI
jgi:hypothetical protein